MSNAIKGVIEAHVSDGRTLKLVFDMNTWADAEEETGRSLQELMSGIQTNSLSAKHQRALFWCALKEHQPEITLRDAGSVFVELAEAMAKALEAALPAAAAEPTGDGGEAGGDAAADPPMKAGTGTSS